uniref:Abhydrolase domain containing 5, lysophosphatidic acid acyltransferase n=1 Tax=Bos taurus TaxID=9913 RepID=S4UWU8_BOVIN|nr:abhydrolase domain-containing protein 5 variant 2 [Bos taurus]
MAAEEDGVNSADASERFKSSTAFKA